MLRMLLVKDDEVEYRTPDRYQSPPSEIHKVWSIALSLEFEELQYSSRGTRYAVQISSKFPVMHREYNFTTDLLFIYFRIKEQT